MDLAAAVEKLDSVRTELLAELNAGSRGAGGTYRLRRAMANLDEASRELLRQLWRDEDNEAAAEEATWD